ncbi:MAG: hypothetical protein E5W57_06780 [Mesorhizobium sp.]|nr:MAG: hypothetical protein E5W57_06780 [Mesorhizobium sp.]
MIDAATFADLYNAFWRSATPTCELFVRRMNLGELNRFDVPMKPNSTTKSPALVAEAGFSAFVISEDRPELKKHPDKLLDIAITDSRIRLQAFKGDKVDLDQDFSDADRKDALTLFSRLAFFFQARREKIVTRPRFPGCGFVDSSEGDVLSGGTLFEIKSVERGFRSADIHQLITYYCLSISAGDASINSLGLINPKRGLSFEIDVNNLCREIAGVGASELSNEVVMALSSGDISR